MDVKSCDKHLSNLELSALMTVCCCQYTCLNNTNPNKACFAIFKTGIATSNSRDIFNTDCDAMSSWSLDPMLSGAVWLKINLEKLVCTLVS